MPEGREGKALQEPSQMFLLPNLTIRDDSQEKIIGMSNFIFIYIQTSTCKEVDFKANFSVR